MKSITKLVGAVSLMVISGLAVANPVNVGGVVWDTDLPASGADSDFTGRFNFDQWFNDGTSNFINPSTLVTGNELRGTGEFQLFNGASINPNSITGGAADSFCPSCELTFNFGGLFVDTATGSFTFAGTGFLDIYVANGALINYDNSSNPLNITGASDGTLFLHLDVVDLGFSPITGAGFTAGSLGLSLQATSGIAKDYFDTNTLGFGFDIGTTASAQFALIDINGDNVNNEWVATSTGQMKGDTKVPVPEPSSLALIGIGLLLAFGRRRAV